MYMYYYICFMYFMSSYSYSFATALVCRVSVKLVCGLQQVRRKEKVCIDVTLEAIDLKLQPHEFNGWQVWNAHGMTGEMSWDDWWNVMGWLVKCHEVTKQHRGPSVLWPRLLQPPKRTLWSEGLTVGQTHCKYDLEVTSVRAGISLREICIISRQISM